MKHEEARELLDAYHDDELSPSLRAEFESHASACGECAAALAEREALSRRLKELVRPRPRADFAEGVLERLDAPRPAPPWMVPAFASGLAAALLVAAFGLRSLATNSGAQSADILWAGENNGSENLRKVTGAEKLDSDQVLSIILEES